jgi:DNA polymerase I-like protein with 3'-5' exonuclease and polymerase domains
LKLITLDFETYYDKKTFSLKKCTTERYIRSPEFQVIGFGYKVDNAPAQWVTGSEEEIEAALRALDIPGNALLAHHMAFDGAILGWRYGLHPKTYYDTRSMAYPLHAMTIGASLAALSTHYRLGAKGTEVEDASGLRQEDFAPDHLARYGEYCKNDVELTYELFHRLREDFPKAELYIIDLFMRMYCDPVLVLDEAVLRQHSKEVVERRGAILKRLADAGVGEEQLMSNKQFAELLTAAGVVPPTKVSPITGRETLAFAKTDTEFKALLEHENPEVTELVAARLGVKSTLEQTRTESFIGIAQRGALPVPLTYYGAHTGRASGWDDINLQNLTRGGNLRRSICAPPGHKLVAVDSAQIEARVTGWLAGQDDLTEAFAKGDDIYSLFAANVYGYPVDKSKPVERFVGKTCILGLGYGMGAERFRLALRTGAVSVDMPPKECKRVVQIYRHTYQHIPALWQLAGEYLDAAVRGHTYDFGVGISLHGTPDGIYLPNGMMVRYPRLRRVGDGYAYDNRKREVYLFGAKVIENVVQALARIVVFTQMAKIEQALRQRDCAGIAGRYRYRVVSTVHDEVIACVPDDYAEDCLKFMQEVMSTPPRWASGLPIACEGNVGQNYADCK